MDYIEKFILNNWKKLPQSVKDKSPSLGIKLEKINSEFPKMIVEIKKGPGGKEIIFYKIPIEEKFEKELSDYLIRELIHCFDFEENEAYELMSKNI